MENGRVKMGLEFVYDPNDRLWILRAKFFIAFFFKALEAGDYFIIFITLGKKNSFQQICLIV